MKEVSLFTKTKIISSAVSKSIIDSYKWKKRIVRNDEGELFLGYFPREFYIIFDDSTPIDHPDCLYTESDKQQIPFSDPQVNELFYRDEEVARYVVSIVYSVHPELYIMDDDGNIMPAIDFIDNKNNN